MDSRMVAKLTMPVGERDHIDGSPDAIVTLLEYGDYECPVCGAAFPEVNRIRHELRDDLRFVYRHFPLSEIHPHALRAAEAAEAAGAQGSFWEMHDTLFENQGTLDDLHLIRFAEMLDLDVDMFTRDLSTGAYRDRVREDFMSGVRSGVNGTPTFFINGIRHDGPWDAGSLMYAIQGAITTAGSAPR